MNNRLYRDDIHKVIGGVCAGLADYLKIDVSIVRLIFVLTLILKGGGLLIYVILWMVLPKKTLTFQMPPQQPFVDYTVPPAGSAPQWDPSLNHPKKTSAGAIIAGTILIIIGGCVLLDDFDIIPDWDLEHLWPLALIGAGIAAIYAGSKKEPWENPNFNKTDNVKEEPANNNSQNDNPTTL